MADDLERSLIDGGISPIAAKLISNAINNAATGRLSTGQNLSDATPEKSMRQIGPHDRRNVFTNLDHPVSRTFADRIALKDTYQPLDRKHPLDRSQPASANPTINTPNLKAGKFVDVKQNNTNDVAQNEVGLKIDEKGGTHARVNKGKGSIESVPFLVKCHPEKLIEASFVEEEGQTVLNIRLKNLDAAGTITGFTDGAHTWLQGSTDIYRVRSYTRVHRS